MRNVEKFKPHNLCFHCGRIWHSIYTLQRLYYAYRKLKPSLNNVKVDPSCIHFDKKCYHKI